MKRDMNLVRDILLTIEEHSNNHDQLRGLMYQELPHYEDSVILEHLILLYEERYIEATRTKTAAGPGICIPIRLTWAGHEYLSAVRDQKIWDTVQEKMKVVGGSATVETIKQLAIKLANDLLNLS